MSDVFEFITGTIIIVVSIIALVFFAGIIGHRMGHKIGYERGALFIAVHHKCESNYGSRAARIIAEELVYKSEQEPQNCEDLKPIREKAAKQEEESNEKFMELK